jgi:hypothetical protein
LEWVGEASVFSLEISAHPWARICIQKRHTVANIYAWEYISGPLENHVGRRLSDVLAQDPSPSESGGTMKKTKNSMPRTKRWAKARALSAPRPLEHIRPLDLKLNKKV